MIPVRCFHNMYQSYFFISIYYININFLILFCKGRGFFLRQICLEAMTILHEAMWQTPRELSGVKSRKRAIFEIALGSVDATSNAGIHRISGTLTHSCSWIHLSLLGFVDFSLECWWFIHCWIFYWGLRTVYLSAWDFYRWLLYKCLASFVDCWFLSYLHCP